MVDGILHYQGKDGVLQVVKDVKTKCKILIEIRLSPAEVAVVKGGPCLTTHISTSTTNF